MPSDCLLQMSHYVISASRRRFCHAFLEKDPVFLPILQRWQETPSSIKDIFITPPVIDLWLDDLELIPKDAQTSNLRIDDFEGNSSANLLGGHGNDQSVNPKGKFSIAREAFNPPAEGKALHITGPLKVGDTLNLETNYSTDGSAKDLTFYQSISLRVKGRGFLKIHSLQPTIRDWDNYVSEILPGSDEWKIITIPFNSLRQAGWGVVLPMTPEALSGILLEVLPAPVVPLRPPGGLFNGMICPLIPFAIRGVAWYQGEGNASWAAQYRKLLPALIRSWRSAWHEDDFPFLIVQLPNFRQSRQNPEESDWAELREAQLLALHLPATGLVVAIDQGDVYDVHPNRKSEIGRRLALWALGTVYQYPVVYSGPMFESMKIEGDKIRLYFSHIGSGMMAKEEKPLRGFAVAGSDRKFHWAETKIEGHSVLAWSEKVSTPVAIRYGWADNPEVSLYNREGLPASPFRTDRWQGITEDNK